MIESSISSFVLQKFKMEDTLNPFITHKLSHPVFHSSFLYESSYKGVSISRGNSTEIYRGSLPKNGGMEDNLLNL
jgi:hypothetical protein